MTLFSKDLNVDNLETNLRIKYDAVRLYRAQWFFHKFQNNQRNGDNNTETEGLGCCRWLLHVGHYFAAVGNIWL